MTDQLAHLHHLLEHRDDCPEPRIREGVAPQGDPSLKCLNCRRFLFNPGALVGEERPEPVGPYRCRTHQDYSVNWKGKGCDACARERQGRRR